jgi:hypothetical protein
MKKQELIHIHGLLAQVQNQCEEWEDESFAMEEYEDLGVRPTSIHKSKTDHKAAVFKLAKGITTGIDAEESEAIAPKAD